MKLILCGGGSGNQNYFANKKLNEIIDHNKPLLYVPLAMDENDHSYDSCYEWIKEELSQVELPEIYMVRTFEELKDQNYNDYCAIFIGGGNTYKLLKGLKESGSFKKIRGYIENNGVIIGGSAGAVIFGKDINIISSMDDNNVNLGNTNGFDVLNGISIFPHYTNYKSKLSEEENMARLDMFTKAISNFSMLIGDVLAIPEEDAIFVNDNNLEILGERPFYYFNNGTCKELKPDENNNISGMVMKTHNI